MVGVDCPALDAAMVDHAFEQLQHYDVVLGPATDGGYYLIALRRPSPDLFRGIRWGTETVLQQSLARAGEQGMRIGLLQMLDDLDRPGDLHLCTLAIPNMQRPSDTVP